MAGILFVTVGEVAKLLGMSYPGVMALITDKKLDATRFGKRTIRIRKHTVAELAGITVSELNEILHDLAELGDPEPEEDEDKEEEETPTTNGPESPVSPETEIKPPLSDPSTEGDDASF